MHGSGSTAGSVAGLGRGLGCRLDCGRAGGCGQVLRRGSATQVAAAGSVVGSALGGDGTRGAGSGAGSVGVWRQGRVLSSDSGVVGREEAGENKVPWKMSLLPELI